jgi:hypothetical protein
MAERTWQDFNRDAAFRPFLFYNVEGRESRGGRSLSNPEEAEGIARLLKLLFDRFPATRVS